MFKKNSRDQLLGLFYTYPTQKFHVREIARLIKLSPATVLKFISELEKANFVHREETIALTQVWANLENEQFQRNKRIFNLQQIEDSGLVDYLIKEYNHPTLVLFGSYARGEDLEKSDIDIAILTHKHKTLMLDKFKEKMKRKINVHELTLEKVSEEFKKSLYNGIVLAGSI